MLIADKIRMKRETLRQIIARLIRMFSRPTYLGSEYLPKEGGLIDRHQPHQPAGHAAAVHQPRA